MDDLIAFWNKRLDDWLEDAKVLDGFAEMEPHLAPNLRAEANLLRADIDAKRTLIRAYEQCATAIPEDERLRHPSDIGYVGGLADALKILFAIYAAHPDFKAEWLRPTY